MAVYEYQAIARSGKTTKGVIDADSPAAARRKLRDQDLHPTDIKESSASAAQAGGGTKGGGGRIRARDVAMLTRQLAVLLEAGMALVEALTALLDQTANMRLRNVIFEVRDRVNEGATLADSLERHPRVFSQLYSNMVRAGEASGALEAVLFRLADLLERQVKLRAQITSALAYPVLMIMVSVGVIVFLMMAVVPRIVQIFAKQEQVLPLPTQILMTTCNFLGSWWWVLALVVAGIYGTWRAWVSRPEGRLRWDRIKLSMPLAGDLYLKVVSSRFARTLGSMLESGLTMMTALDVVKSVLDNRVVEGIIDDVKTGVRRGRDLSTPLKEAGIFPPMLIHMIELGQRSGKLEGMLLKTADTYEDEVGMAVDALVSLLGPLVIIIMGIFIGFLVFSIMLPIFKMSSGL